MVNIIVCGASGRMGSSIIRLAGLDKEIKLCGAVENKNTSFHKKDAELVYDLSEVITSGKVVIDFTCPEASMDHLKIVEKNNKCMVLGTTGFSSEEIDEIKTASKKIPIVFSPNMSIGINILFKLAAETAKHIPGYDIEILELHHNQKKDAPSGTAIKLSEVIANSLDKNINDIAIYGRHGIIGPRKKDEIGIMSVRAGDIVGDHTVYFVGNGERIELTHRAHSRDTLAAGAILAAKWVADKKPGLYNMQDVLGLTENNGVR